MNIQNVIAKTKCETKFDRQNLVKYSNALMDVGFAGVKYCFERPSQPNGKEITVNVFESGAIVSTGANSVYDAKKYIKKILEQLNVKKHDEIQVSQVVMTGSYAEEMDVSLAIPELEKSYEVKFDAGVMHAVMLRSDKIVIQVQTTGNPTYMVCRGPDEESVEKLATKVYECIKRANGIT